MQAAEYALEDSKRNGDTRALPNAFSSNTSFIEIALNGKIVKIEIKKITLTKSLPVLKQGKEIQKQDKHKAGTSTINSVYDEGLLWCMVDDTWLCLYDHVYGDVMIGIKMLQWVLPDEEFMNIMEDCNCLDLITVEQEIL